MKNPKNKIFIFIIIVILIIAGISIGIYCFSKKSASVLTLEETQWIENNKHNVIDVAILNDIPIISNNGEGIIYDYLNYVNKKNSLEFNVIPYKIDSKVESQYKLNLVLNVDENDIVIYEDNFIYVTPDNKEYKSKNEIRNIKIGVLESQKEYLSGYFKDQGIEFVGYENYDKLKAAFSESKANIESGTPASVSGIIIVKSLFTKEMIENNYKISYQLTDLKSYYVLNIADSKELKSIMSKQYKNWKLKKYKESYNNNLLKDYTEFKKISDVEEKKLKSKSYVFGFVNNGIFNTMKKNKLSGINGILLSDFNEFSGISITYTKYNSINKLLESFNSNKVDFILNLSDESKYKNEVFKTTGAIDNNLVSQKCITSESASDRS